MFLTSACKRRLSHHITCSLLWSQNSLVERVNELQDSAESPRSMDSATQEMVSQLRDEVMSLLNKLATAKVRRVQIDIFWQLEDNIVGVSCCLMPHRTTAVCIFKSIGSIFAAFSHSICLCFHSANAMMPSERPKTSQLCALELRKKSAS